MKRLAIVGLGGWGRRLVESVYEKSTLVNFTTAVVRDRSTAADFAASRNLKLETDLDSVLADPSIDGVVSSGPAHLHAAHTLAALRAGKPVLAVKPMALNRHDADMLVATAAERNLLLALGYNRCFFPNVADLRKRLSTGVLGRIVHTEGDFCVDRYRQIKRQNWKANPEWSPAGSLADHMLYLTIETLGAIDEVHTLSARNYSDNELADASAVLLRTKAGQSASLTAIGVTPDYYRFQVFGEKGWIEIRDANELTFQPLSGKREVITFDQIDSERAEVEAFAAAIAGERPFPVSAAEAAHGVAVLEAMGRSAIEQRPLKVG